MSTTAPHRDFAPRVEADRVSPASLWWTGAISVAVVVASVFVAGFLLRVWSRPAYPERGRSPLREGERVGQEIGLVERSLIRRTRRGLNLEAAQRESLRHFGWVDRQHGIAKIPIDRAIDLVTDPAFVRAFESEPLDAAVPGEGGGR
jgi:hypothetical protein